MRQYAMLLTGTGMLTVLVAVAWGTVDAFRFPELTQTQLFLRNWQLLVVGVALMLIGVGLEKWGNRT